MKILMVASQMDTGGTETLTVKLANKFSELVDCRFFLLKPESNKLLSQLSKNIKVHCGNGHFLGSLKIFRNLVKECSPDVILCQSNSAYLIARLSHLFSCKRKIVLALHYTNKYGLKNYLSNFFVFLLVKIFKDRLIASYDKQIELFSTRHCLNKSLFTRIYNGVEIDSEGFENNKPQDYVSFIHVANYREEKSQDVLFKALVLLENEYKNWKLYFRGSVPEDKMLEFSRFLEENNIRNKVEFIGYANSNKDLYAGKDVFVLTSKTEALPMTIIEAMSNKLPCIVTDVGGCGEIVENGKSGFVVEALNPEAVAEKMKFYIKNRSKIKQDGENAFNRVNEFFEINKTVKEYLKTLEK